MAAPTVIKCSWQRLDPPFSSEPIPGNALVYQNAVVVSLESGDRLVFDRDDLAELVVRPPLRAA